MRKTIRQTFFNLLAIHAAEATIRGGLRFLRRRRSK